MTKAISTIFAAALLCLAVSAQEKSADKKKPGGAMPAGMQMPKPGPEMKDLRDLVGTWTTDETYEVSPFMPTGGTGSGTTTTRLGPGGFSILIDTRSKNAMGSFSGHGVIAWDADAKAYKFSWVDSMTPALVMETGHKEGGSIVFTGAMMMQGKKYQTKDVISDVTPGSYTLTSYSNDGTGEKKSMTMKFTKQEAPAKK